MLSLKLIKLIFHIIVNLGIGAVVRAKLEGKNQVTTQSKRYRSTERIRNGSYYALFLPLDICNNLILIV